MGAPEWQLQGYSLGSSETSEEPLGHVANSAQADQAQYTSAFGSSDYSEEPVNAIGRNFPQKGKARVPSSSRFQQHSVAGGGVNSPVH